MPGVRKATSENGNTDTLTLLGKRFSIAGHAGAHVTVYLVLSLSEAALWIQSADETEGPPRGADRPGEARCVLRGRQKDRSTDLLFLLFAVLLPLAIKESWVLVAGSPGNSKSRAQSRAERMSDDNKCPSVTSSTQVLPPELQEGRDCVLSPLTVPCRDAGCSGPSVRLSFG